MAYPLTKLPTKHDFIDRAISEYGAKIKKVDGTVCFQSGEVEVDFLVIENGNDPKFATIPDLADHDI